MELAIARRPDLILLDMDLAGVDGHRALELLRSDRRLRHVPVVAISADAAVQDIERGRMASFTEYLAKPLNLDQFNELLDRLLGNPVQRGQTT
jgi:CheY-like chemotaxis protein